MSDVVNMVELIDELAKRPRGRACVVLTHDYFGQKPWAAELARQTGMKHMDLLNLFANSDDLSAKISLFSVDELFRLLQTQSGTSVLIVTGIEFLKAAWSANSNAVEQFASRVETWPQSPALLFVMQFDSALVKRTFTRFPQCKFVVDQKETLALT